MEGEAATALLVAQLVAHLADLRLKGAVIDLLTEIALVLVLVLPRDRLQPADLVDVLHAPGHLGVGQRALTTTRATGGSGGTLSTLVRGGQ